MEGLRRVARPALEEAVQLLRESSDWNPALKSAAGGLAYILSTIRLRSDNRGTCEDLLARIVAIARDLANEPQDTPNVRSRLERFERCLLRLAAKLKRCQDSGRLASHLRAHRDAKVLRDCEGELNAACLDMQLFLGLADANRNDEILAALQRNDESLTVLHRNNEVLAALQRNEALLLSIDHGQSKALDSVASRTELFSVLGRRCALVRKSSGDKIIEADASIVLFA